MHSRNSRLLVNTLNYMGATSTTFILSLTILDPASASDCQQKFGGATTICGINGGTSSQVFSPGSVIILQNRSTTFSGDLPVAVLPEDVREVLQQTPFILSTMGPSGSTSTRSGFSFEAIRGWGEQSETEFERQNSSDATGGIISVWFENPGLTLQLGMDYVSTDTDYESGSIGAGLTLSGFPIPVPPASEDREDYGIRLDATYEMQPGLVAFGGARIGRIDIQTNRLSYDLVSTDDPQSPVLEDNIKSVIRGQGETDGMAYSARVGLAYGSNIGGGFIGGVSGSLLWAKENINGFTETDDTGPTFTFGDDNRESFLSRFGVELTRPFYSGNRLFVPALRAAWLHEFADDSRTIDVHANAKMTGSINTPTDFTIQTNPPDRNYFTVGAALDVAFADGNGSLGIAYEALLGHDYLDAQVLRFGLSYRF